jgi:hypothetical protein
MWRPLSPFEQRMQEFARMFPPPPSHPAHKILLARAQFEAERDVAFRMWADETRTKVPSFILTRMEGGTNFPVANTLRSFFQEYARRFMANGPHSLPTSFNVVESFLRFSHDYFVFDLREEREHLIRLDDYLDWYTRGEFPEDPAALRDVVPEAIAYSYNAAGPLNDFRIQTPESELALFGISLIRHASELSMLAVLGERPPMISDDDASKAKIGDAPRGKEGIKPAADWTVKDRYLEEAPTHCRVVALVRFDLVRCKYEVRYVNVDMGASFFVATDDSLIFDVDQDAGERRRYLDRMNVVLKRYDPLFSAMGALMFLPAFFIAERQRVTVTTFATPLHARRDSPEVQKAAKLLGRNAVSFSRDVSCMRTDPQHRTEATISVEPPDLELATEGFWKPLPPGVIGKDEAGQPIVGRTWVERTDSWVEQRLESFVVDKSPSIPEGPKPGAVYVMRSASHGVDLYKIGRTTAGPERRATELTGATGVPTPFEVLAHWVVGDVEYVEKEAHRALRQYKVNRRREFFRAPLTLIVSTIGRIVDDYVARSTSARSKDH